MKKFVVLSFISLLILAFGATVYGQEKAPVLEFKGSGMIDFQTFWGVNMTQANGGAVIYAGRNPGDATTFAYSGNFDAAGNPTSPLDKPAAWFESRTRLKFDAIYGKELSGTILFEFDATPWGTGGGGTRNSYGYWGGDRDSLEVKNIYFDFALPYFGIPVPMTFRIGEQSMVLRPALLMATDGAGINVGLKYDPLLVAVWYGKPWEGDVGNADDGDMLAIHANVKVSTVTIGGYWLYHNWNTYPVVAAGTARNNTMMMNWFGGYLDGKLGPVNVNIDAIVDFGKVEARHNQVTGTIDESVNYTGCLFHGKLEIPWEKFNFGLLGYWASGADAEKSGPTGLPGANPNRADGRQSYRQQSYVIPVSSESAAAYGESVVFHSFWLTRGDSGVGNNINYTQLQHGIGGSWAIKAFAGFKFHPDHKITLQGMYLGDTTRNGNTYGNARNTDGTLKDSASIGWELDAIWEWQLYRQLKFGLAGGFLVPGNAMELWSGNAAAGNHNPKMPWAVVSNMTYTF